METIKTTVQAIAQTILRGVIEHPMIVIAIIFLVFVSFPDGEGKRRFKRKTPPTPEGEDALQLVYAKGDIKTTLSEHKTDRWIVKYTLLAVAALGVALIIASAYRHSTDVQSATAMYEADSKVTIAEIEAAAATAANDSEDAPSVNVTVNNSADASANADADAEGVNATPEEEEMAENVSEETSEEETSEEETESAEVEDEEDTTQQQKAAYWLRLYNAKQACAVDWQKPSTWINLIKQNKYRRLLEEIREEDPELVALWENFEYLQDYSDYSVAWARYRADTTP